MIYEKALGPEKPDTAGVMVNLACLYKAQDKYFEAEPLYKRALSIFEKATIEPNDQGTSFFMALSLDDLAEIYKAQSKYSEAEPLYKQALTIFEKALGPDGLRVAIVLGHIADLYRKTGRQDEAEKLSERAMKIIYKNR